MATTATPHRNTAPAGFVNFHRPTADAILDGPYQYVGLNLEPVAASLIRDMVKAPIVRGCLAELIRMAKDNPPSLLDSEYVQVVNELVRRLSRDGALTVVLDLDQAEGLAGDLDNARIDRTECPACGNLHDHPLGGRCASCEEARR